MQGDQDVMHDGVNITLHVAKSVLEYLEVFG